MCAARGIRDHGGVCTSLIAQTKEDICFLHSFA
jgi:hypothetical protein